MNQTKEKREESTIHHHTDENSDKVAWRLLWPESVLRAV
jgi:hypothetical protein